MNGAWWFVAGWLSATAIVAIALLHRRSQHWLDAENSLQFAIGCEDFVDTHPHFYATQPIAPAAVPLIARLIAAMDLEPVRTVR